MDNLFLDSWYIPLLWICFFTSLTVYIQKNTPRWLKFFPLFMLITVAVETAGAAIADKGQYNVWLYNAYTILEVPFYLLVVRSNIDAKVPRIMIAYGAGIYAITKTIYLFILPPASFHYVFYFLGALLILVFGFYFFYLFFKKTTFLQALFEPAFWICGGLCIYFTGSLPIFIIFGNYRKFLPSITMSAAQLNIYLNLTIYSMFIIGFLCRFALGKTTS